MPSSKKKKQGNGKAKKGKNKASSSSSGATANPPRSIEQIVGRPDPNRPPKKCMVRELYEALLYEVNSESRGALIAKVEALEDYETADADDGSTPKEDGDDKKSSANSPDMPITYETKEMIDYPGRCMLTVGRNAPFTVQKVYHAPPAKLLHHFRNDEEALTRARRWTGNDPVVNILFPQLRLLGTDSIVFLGECYLDKEDVAHFAGRFMKGSGGSTYDWPSPYAVLQCPFTCTMAVPEKDKTTPRKRYVMILQNIRQVAIMNGGLHMPHRGLPRLCDGEYFAKNLRGEAEFSEDGSSILVRHPDWSEYPRILEEGIVFGAAKKVLPTRTASYATDSASYLPSAYTLFNFYHECGMCAAVSEVIDAKQNKIFKESPRFPNVR